MVEFKEGDEVMGIHTDFVGRSELVCGKITQIEKTDISKQEPLQYHITGIEYKFSGVLSPNEIVKFDGFKWMQIEIFYKERDRLLEEVYSKFRMIKTLIYSTGMK